MTIWPLHFPELASARCNPACLSRELPWEKPLKSPASPNMPAKDTSLIPFMVSSFLAKGILFNASVTCCSTLSSCVTAKSYPLITVLNEIYKHQVLV